MRLAAALLLSILVSVVVGCGGSSPAADDAETSSEAPAGSLEALWRAPGADVGDRPRDVRLRAGPQPGLFLIVDKQSRLITTPTARVWVARGLKQAPFLQTIARSEPIGVAGGATADAGDIYVAHVRLAKPGKYWLLADPVGAKAADPGDRQSRRSGAKPGAVRR